MTEYLITNARTLAETWIKATTITQALISHERARRAVSGEAPLPKNPRASHDSVGTIISAMLGYSYIRGRRENVVRED